MPQTVANWLKQGSMPAGLQLRAFLRATAAGWTVEPIAFGLQTDGDTASIDATEAPESVAGASTHRHT